MRGAFDGRGGMSPKQFIASVRHRLIEEGPASADADDFQGYSQDEVTQVETITGQRLPEYYEEFLAVLGKTGGGFMRGTHSFMKDAAEFVRTRQWAVKLMAQSGADESLSENAFVLGD